MLFRKNEKEQRKISKWYTADLSVCVAVLIFYPMTFLSYSYFFKMWGAAFWLVVVLFFAKRLYYADKTYPKPLKITAIVVRSILYTASAVGLLLPFTMNNDWTWYYPVQRAVYLSNYSDGSFLEDFLPEAVPLDAEDYQVTFVPKILQGEAVVEISFYTDSETLAEYIAYAESQYTTHYNIEGVKSEKWKNWLIEDNIDYNGAVVYEFDGPYTPVYIVNEKTGYIRIYY